MRDNGLLGSKVLSSRKQSIGTTRGSKNAFNCVKYANARGAWGHAPQENLCFEIESEPILESTQGFDLYRNHLQA